MCCLSQESSENKYQWAFSEVLECPFRFHICPSQKYKALCPFSLKLSQPSRVRTQGEGSETLRPPKLLPLCKDGDSKHPGPHAHKKICSLGDMLKK